MSGPLFTPGADSGPNASQQEGEALPTQTNLGTPQGGQQAPQAPPQAPPQQSPQPQVSSPSPMSHFTPPPLLPEISQPWRREVVQWANHPAATDSGLKRLAKLVERQGGSS